MQTDNLTEKKHVVIVDDHPILRRCMTLFINEEPDLTVVGEAEDSGKALEIFSQTSPDIAIIDISLKGSNGIELLKTLASRKQHLPVLIVSMHDESLYAERALKAGAKGYVSKQAPTETVLDAIRCVLKGEFYLSESMRTAVFGTKLPDDPSPDLTRSKLAELSDRELEIFQLIGFGNSTREIAESLHLSIKTIESHRQHLKRKLQVKNSAELVREAITWMRDQFY